MSEADTMMPLSEAHTQLVDLLSKFVVNNNSDHERLYKLIDILSDEALRWRFPLHRIISFDYATGILPRKVLSIIGPGATALARNLYNKNRGQFICAAQVDLSVESDMKITLGHILRRVTGGNDSYDALEESQLVQRIKEALTFKRYLMVVLDIWKESEWASIAGAFPTEFSGSSRVITTTRRNKVADACCSGTLDLVYKLDCPWPEDEAEAVQEKRERVEMQREVDDVPTHPVVSGSGNRAWEDCVLYLSTLPEHDAFERESLVRKWLAGKLVVEKEVANSYFDELVNRNVVLRHPQGEHCYRFGEEPTYYVRPTILGVLRKMSKEKCFVTFMSNNGPPASASPERCAHLVFRSQPLTGEEATTTTTTTTVDLHDAASVTARGHLKGVILPLKHLENYKVLVLDLEGCKDVKDQDVVDICRHMTLLRYLSLKGTPVTVIPVDIHNLICLDTLDVRETRLQQLPKEVALLRNLECLLFSGGVKFVGQLPAACYSSDPDPSSSTKVLGAVHQSELQTCLAHAKEVRDLVVVCNGEGDLRPGPLSNYLHLEKLKVVGRCVKLPASIKAQQLSKAITVLDIRMGQMKEGDLEALGKMASLQSLALSLVSLPMKEIAVCGKSDGDGLALFQRLELFALDCRVPWVTFHDKAMPALQSLYLKLYSSAGGDDNLKTPSGTVHLASLREVTLHFSRCYAGSASVTRTVAAVEKELGPHHAGNKAVTLFVNGEHKIPKIQAPEDIIYLLPNWCMRNFLECLAMPTIYLARCCYNRSNHHAGNFLLCMLAIALLVLLLPRLLSYFLLPKITNMAVHKIAGRAFACKAIMLPLPLVFSALEGNSKWLPVLHFSIFILLDVCSYQPFTRAFPKLIPLFLLYRNMYVQTGSFNVRVLAFIPICTLLFCGDHLHMSDIWNFVTFCVVRLTT